jgi:hypothetical protein
MRFRGPQALKDSQGPPYSPSFFPLLGHNAQTKGSKNLFLSRSWLSVGADKFCPPLP